MFRVPVLIPSLTRKMIFLAILFLLSVIEANVSNGDNKDVPKKANDPFLKKSLLFMFLLIFNR